MSKADVQRALQSFGGDIKRFSDKIGVKFEVALKRLALEIYAAVTEKTPVDTGRARASWNISRGTIDYTVWPEREKSIVDDRPGGIGEDGFTSRKNQTFLSPRGQTWVRGVAANKMAHFKGAKLVARGPAGSIFISEPVFITNNLHYVIYLEHGSSKQAPQGMVAVTLAEVEAGLARVLRA